MKERNAFIESVSLGSDDHGGITCWLHLQYSRGTMQGFGGYDLRWWGGYYLQRILDIVGVENWEDCPGKTIRVRKAEELGSITAIGHITEDDWFEPGSAKDRNAAIRERMDMGKATK